jgi:hypothetical protein
MQSAGARTELNVSVLAVHALTAIPQASAAVHALLAIERGNFPISASDRLSGTHFHTQFWIALVTKRRIDEHNVIRISRGRLHTSAHQQRVLM